MEELADNFGMKPRKTNVAVQGFGNVGMNIARILHELGYKVIAVSDSKGGILNKKGLNIKDVINLKNKTGHSAGGLGDRITAARLQNSAPFCPQIMLGSTWNGSSSPGYAWPLRVRTYFVNSEHRGHG